MVTVTDARPAVGELVFKRMPIDRKAVSEDKATDTAEFDAYAAAFNNIDSHGDVIRPGAFLKSLEAWEAKGAPIPVYFNHGIFTDDPQANIGFLSSVTEDDAGLKVTPVLDIGMNEKAAYTYHLIKSGRIRELSIGFVTKAWEWGEQDGVEVRFINEVELLEVSVVPVASNDQATVTEVRSAAFSAKASDEAVEQLAAIVSSFSEAVAGMAEKFSEVLAKVAEGVESTDGADADADSTDNSESDDSGDNDTGEGVEGKGGKLSARARAALASIALVGAESELA